jgi:hypothetical protein
MSLPGLDEIAAMDRPALVTTWTDILGRPPARKISMPLMRQLLGFEVQARRYGGLPAGLVQKLTRLEKGRDPTPAVRLDTGGRLLREWNGITHVVDVTPQGYLWRGTTWRSLTAIAREITGAHWSGPRFFGLKGSRAS